MKTADDPRHIRRENTIKALFSQSFHAQPIANKTAKEILSRINQIDDIITKIAPDFPTDKINKVDLAILRLAIYELQFSENSVPPKVIIDEAIELAKEYGGEHSPAFVNGALGKLLRETEKNT